MSIECERDTEMQKNTFKLLGLSHARALLKFPGNLKAEEFGKSNKNKHFHLKNTVTHKTHKMRVNMIDNPTTKISKILSNTHVIVALCLMQLFACSFN